MHKYTYKLTYTQTNIYTLKIDTLHVAVYCLIVGMVFIIDYSPGCQPVWGADLIAAMLPDRRGGFYNRLLIGMLTNGEMQA